MREQAGGNQPFDFAPACSQFLLVLLCAFLPLRLRASAAK
jgi:hypothetical protein